MSGHRRNVRVRLPDVLGFAIVALATGAAGCRDRGRLPPPALANPTADWPPVPPAPRTEVQLTWRLLDTRRWLDADDRERQSSLFELTIAGGTPSHVELGRRESLGCAVREPGDDTPTVTGLECRTATRREYAYVERPRAGELRIEAFGQDQTRQDDPPVRTNDEVASVSVPVDAEIVVDRQLVTIPADAIPRSTSPSLR